MTDTQLLKATDVCRLLEVKHRSSVLRYVDAGVLAQPYRRTKGGHGLWRYKDVEAARRILIERRTSARTA